MNAKADKRADATAPDTEPAPETLPHDLRFPANFQPESIEAQIRIVRADFARFRFKHELPTSLGHDINKKRTAMPCASYNMEMRRRRSVLWTLLQIQKQQQQTQQGT